MYISKIAYPELVSGSPRRAPETSSGYAAFDDKGVE